jgi:hypothetical protein
MKTIKIPDDLTGDEALCITALLEQIIAAVWAQHGDAMQERLEAHRRRARADPRCVVCQPDDVGDDDLPFEEPFDR